MAETIIEYDTPQEEIRNVANASEEGCGCLPILIIIGIVWFCGSFFVDGGISCCFASMVVIATILLYKIFTGRR